MKKLAIEIVFFLIMSAIILPTPTLILAHMTGQTWREVSYR
jgi:hypothetical protein